MLNENTLEKRDLPASGPVIIPKSLQEMYDLAVSLKLPLPGLPVFEVKDMYDKREYPFWSQFVDGVKKHRAKALGDLILRNHVRETIAPATMAPKSRVLAIKDAYRKTEEYRAALSKALAEDLTLVRLCAAKPGDPAFEKSYFEFHLQYSSMLHEKQRGILKSALWAYNEPFLLDLIAPYREESYFRELLNSALEKLATQVEHHLTQEAVFFPDFDIGDYNALEYSDLEISSDNFAWFLGLKNALLNSIAASCNQADHMDHYFYLVWEKQVRKGLKGQKWIDKKQLDEILGDICFDFSDWLDDLGFVPMKRFPDDLLIGWVSRNPRYKDWIAIFKD